jgi:hypothetical protein
MTNHFSRIFIFGALLIFFLLSTGSIWGQKPTVETVKKVLTEGAGFSSENWEALEKGELIVRELDAKTETEVSFAGAIKLDASRDVVYSAFRRAVERQRAKLSKERGFFNETPSVKDLTKLQIKDSEIRSLKNCKPGDCSWSLSSDLIKRFTEDIDWSASDADEQAKKLFKQIMVEHMTAYLQKGTSGLMDYNDDPEPLSLADEQKSLLEGLLWIDDFAPELKEYLQNYPDGKLEGVEELATWEKVRIAFKSVIINSHGTFYKKNDGDVEQGLIISKQIYANHFFHSSMSLTGIISFPKPENKFDTYLFFVNSTRAGALAGTTGKLLSAAVDGEAENNLKTVLKDTRKYTAYELGNDEELVFEEESGMFQRIFFNKFCIGIIILILIVLAIIWFTRGGENKNE